jgi:cytoskeletal protein RodZ
VRTTASLLIVVGLSLSACSDDPEPADVPTPTDSLTTDAESETGPETQSPTSDEMSTTSEPATNSPPDDETTTTSPPDDEATTSQAAGIPELPDEATEDSEAGAEAFALHYMELINATGIEPETGVLEPLGADGCESCDNYEANVEFLASENLRNDGPAARVTETNSTFLGQTTRVEVTVDQLEVDVIDERGEIESGYEEVQGVLLVFRLAYSDEWLVEEITVDQ